MPFGGLGERLALLIDADASGAVRELQKVGDTSEKQFSKAQSSQEKWSKGLLIGGAAAVGFSAVVGKGLLSAAHASEEAEAASLKLQNTMQNEPALAGASASAFDKLAHHIGETTKVGHVAATAAEALLGSFGLTQKQIEQLLPVVVDLSVKTGVDLDTAAKKVGKTIENGTNSLKPYGVELDKTALKADAFGTVLNGLTKTVGGFAEEQGKTFSGRLSILHNQLDDLKENVGKGVVEAYSKALDPVVALSKALANTSDQTQEAVGQFLAVGQVAVGAGGSVATFVGAALQAKPAFITASQGAGVFGTSLTGVGAAASGALVVLPLLAAAYAAFTQDSRDAAKAQADFLQQLESGTSRTELAAGAVADLAGEYPFLQGVLAKLGVSLSDVQAAILGQPDALKKVALALNEMSKQGGDSALIAKILGDEIRANSHELDGAVGSFKASASATKELNAAMEANHALQRTWDSDWKDYARAVTDARDALTDLKEEELDEHDAQRDYNAALRDQTTAVLDVTEKQKALTQAQKDYGLQSPQAIRAALDLQAAQDGVGAANDAAARAFLNLAAKQAGYKIGSQNSGQATQGFIEHLGNLITTLAPGNPLRKYLEDYIKSLHNIPDSVTTHINVVTGTGAVPTSQRTRAGVGGTVGAHASGGDVHAGDVSVVGEHGPEIVKFEAPGHVFPTGHAPAAQSAAGDEYHFHIHVGSTVGMDGRKLARDLADELSRDTRSGGPLTQALKKAVA